MIRKSRETDDGSAATGVVDGDVGFGLAAGAERAGPGIETGDVMGK